LGPKEDRSGRPTQAVRHTCSGIAKKIIAPHKQKSIVKKFFWQDDGPLANGALCLSTPRHNGKFGTGYHTIIIN